MTGRAVQTGIKEVACPSDSIPAWAAIESECRTRTRELLLRPTSTEQHRWRLSFTSSGRRLGDDVNVALGVARGGYELEELTSQLWLC